MSLLLSQEKNTKQKMRKEKGVPMFLNIIDTETKPSFETTTKRNAQEGQVDQKQEHIHGHDTQIVKATDSAPIALGNSINASSCQGSLFIG